MLKLHGTVSHPQEIVLTKRDYIRYSDRFAALAGIVQSTLLTRHLLSIGFSLEDDNFHKIFDSVRKAKTTQNESTSEFKQNFLEIKLLQAQLSKFDNDDVEDQHQNEDQENLAHLSTSNSTYCTALILKQSRLKVF